MFVLGKGANPLKDFMHFAENKQMQKKVYTLSMGKGLGIRAEKMIAEAAHKGAWVLLQNCHLAVTWLASLSKICENFAIN